MKRRYIVIPLLIASLSIAVLHTLALEFSWYWVYRRFDIPMHLLGGFIIAKLAFFVLKSVFPRYTRQAGLYQILAILVTVTLIIGGVWELLENALGLTRDAGYTRDTIKDIWVDAAGALLAAVGIVALRTVTSNHDE